MPPVLKNLDTKTWISSKDYKIYSKFLENLARKLTQYYYSKLNKTFKISNKKKNQGYDPVTS